MNISPKYVFVVDWTKQYSTLIRWNNGVKENIFPFKTQIPDYSSVDHHWTHVYEPNLTLKGTVNKRDPRRLVEKIPTYKSYKWEILEIFKHPKAGEYYYTKEEQIKHNWPDTKYTTEDLYLLASSHTDKDWMKCYIVIGASGVSELTPEQYKDKQFNAFIGLNLNKWNRENIERKDVPKELISCFYDQQDTVLFGAHTTKGLVSYLYLEGRFSADSKPIYLGCTVSYDGEGNKKCPNPELIKPFDYIKNYLEG